MKAAIIAAAALALVSCRAHREAVETDCRTASRAESTLLAAVQSADSLIVEIDSPSVVIMVKDDTIVRATARKVAVRRESGYTVAVVADSAVTDSATLQQSSTRAPRSAPSLGFVVVALGALMAALLLSALRHR